MSPARHRTIRALVLRSVDIGETSRLVGLFTAEHGRVTVRARGVRARASREAAVLEPFNLIEARIVHREGAEIHAYAEGSVLAGNAALRSDVARAGAAALWTELLDRVDCAPSDAQAVLGWADAALRALGGTEWGLDLGLLGAWQLLGLLGHQPVVDRCVDTGERPREPFLFHITTGGLVAKPPEGGETVFRLSAEAVRALASCVESPPEQLASLHLTAAQRQRLLDLLDHFCQVHLELRLRSLRFLHSLEAPR